MRNVERAEDDGVEGGENDGVGADGQRKRQDGGNSESRRFAQHADADARVLQNAMNKVAADYFVNLLFEARLPTELGARLAFGIDPRNPGPHQIVGAVLDMRAELLSHVLIQRRALEQRAEVRQEIHSSRSKTSGSMDSARWAGIHVASKPSSAIESTTPVSTTGSRGVAWYTMNASTLDASSPSSKPVTEPNASSLMARPKAACRTSLRCAPSAIRIPSSRMRLLTEYAAMPKIPVIESTAPMMPSTPSAMVATRGANSTPSSPLFHVSK